MYSLEQKNKAIDLRKDGKSVRYIAKLLSVSIGSVSSWVRHVELTKEQKDKLVLNKDIISGNKAWQEKRRIDREKYFKKGYEKSKENDSIHAYCCALYSGEGSKTGNSQMQFANCDNKILKIYIGFLRYYFNVPNEKISINIICKAQENISINDIHNYWLRELGLDNSCLRKPSIRDNISKSNKYPYGVCRICVCDFKIRQQIDGAIFGYSELILKQNVL
ncbi:MAG TPA: hypothetical protein PLD56_10370 [Chitinophagales bacterium]|nr:hypothetical protein [Chitinophagales bacterium]